jgi:hypothetical protein
MQPNAPDLLDLRIRLMLGILGAILLVVGWIRALT